MYVSLICVTATNSLCTAKGVLESAGILPPIPLPPGEETYYLRETSGREINTQKMIGGGTRDNEGLQTVASIGSDCKTVGFFFSKSVRKSVKRGVRVLHARSSQASHACSVSPQSHSPFWASFQTFRLTTRAYLNTQKYGLFCTLALDIRFALISLPPACHLPRGW